MTTSCHISPWIIWRRKEMVKRHLWKVTGRPRIVLVHRWLKGNIMNPLGKIVVSSGSGEFSLSLKSISEWLRKLSKFRRTTLSENSRILVEMLSKVEHFIRTELFKISTWRSSQFETVAQPEDSSKNPSKLSSVVFEFTSKPKWLIEAIIWPWHNSALLKVFSALAFTLCFLNPFNLPSLNSVGQYHERMLSIRFWQDFGLTDSMKCNFTFLVFRVVSRFESNISKLFQHFLPMA